MNKNKITQEQFDKIIKTLKFYGDPRSYHGIGFIADPPCGDFYNDFDSVHSFTYYIDDKPGAKAREVLREINIEIDENEH